MPNTTMRIGTAMNLDRAIVKHVSAVPEAIAALNRMTKQLTQAKTYEQIRRVIKEANAILILQGHVDIVKTTAEDTIIEANARIGEELAKVPKATPGRKNSVPRTERNPGREATGVPRASRSRLMKLAQTKPAERKRVADNLRKAGKDATVTAVVREITQGSKSERRATRERELAGRIKALPNKRYGVILADPAWRFQPRSRETGMDRAAENHYPTMPTEDIKAMQVPAADDCVLYLWATIPMLLDALAVMAAWNFDYVSHYTWTKDKIGPGYWVREKHELLLIGTRGNVPCPAPGEQFESVITAPRGEHSAKPASVHKLIEKQFPNLPRVELFARGKPPIGWSTWGNEAEP